MQQNPDRAKFSANLNLFVIFILFILIHSLDLGLTLIKNLLNYIGYP